MDTLPCSSQSVGPANQLLGLLLQTLFADQCGLIPPWPPSAPAIDNNVYDFIVVGSGSGGSVVASRLSENPDWNVLLLEAGGDPPLESEIPATLFYLQTDATDWIYLSEPSAFASLGLNNATVGFPRGKMLGGCSAHNGLLYNRGNDRDFRRWAASGLPSWNWPQVLKYFKKSEDNGTPSIAADTEHHSTGGPLKVNTYNFTGPLFDLIENSYSELGMQRYDDINADYHLGYFNIQGTIFEGARYSAAKAFLLPAANRPNLQIIKNAQVTTLKINKNKSIAGVNYVQNGNKYTALTKKEVILSAGVINTPQILLNSGIGPAQQLKALNIGLVADLPVGLNLQDHVFVLYPIVYNEPLLSEDTTSAYYEYLTQRTGPFSNLGTLEVIASITTTNNPKYADISYFSFSFNQNDPGLALVLNKFNFGPNIANPIVTANQNGPMLVYIITLLNPLSRGRVELKSNNPLDKPKIITNFLEIQSDVNTLIDGVRQIQKLNTTNAFIENKGQVVRLDICNDLPYDSDQYWECYIRYVSTSFCHTVGTAKMGSIADQQSVVDARLKVKKVKGLRVIDASIMPIIPSGNTNAPTIMIAEKGSDLIKDDWAYLDLFNNFK